MSLRKVAVIGAGTQGSISAAYWHRFTDCEVEWVFDPSKPAMSVGEGTTAKVPQVLEDLVGFDYDDLSSLKGTPKLGLHKRNWSSCKAFDENFMFGSIGMHFTATEFQDYMVRKLDVSRVNIRESNVSSHDDVDADLIVDCSGAPEELSDEFNASEHIPVNTATIVQCEWDSAKFNHTLTIAMPFGWIFGIPLQNRCSIGYIHNANFTTGEEVLSGIDKTLSEYGLVASSEPRTIYFNNYTRKNNFSERCYYNGNASFFLEPLEATSLSFGCSINERALETYLNDRDFSAANAWYKHYSSEIETVIMYNYFVGSAFDNDFWSYASEKGKDKMNLALQNDGNFKMLIHNVLNRKDFPDYCGDFSVQHDMPYGTWSSAIWHKNIVNLGGFKL